MGRPVRADTSAAPGSEKMCFREFCFSMGSGSKFRELLGKSFFSQTFENHAQSDEKCVYVLVFRSMFFGFA